jgi:hypothetical protein
MKPIIRLLLIALVMSLIASTAVSAQTRTEQKLIMVQGTESKFMKGEDKPLFNITKDGALPYLLAQGWRIVSVHVNERSQEGNLYGYVVIEREIPSQ